MNLRPTLNRDTESAAETKPAGGAALLSLHSIETEPINILLVDDHAVVRDRQNAAGREHHVP